MKRRDVCNFDNKLTGPFSQAAHLIMKRRAESVMCPTRRPTMARVHSVPFLTSVVLFRHFLHELTKY